ncbi:cell division protein FtsQ [Planococcus sp. N028]|uniref:Cell division protein FtsQ n=1 Tax=Planococcus shixiaomingii TaxID=3058393 RepID=A0ABT8N3M1_9BACL|nr:cell division protein FtsQ [Planococcus sp. N028]MDN7242466.1 cell division protein FtsQ [Planococcus sp. N028]
MEHAKKRCELTQSQKLMVFTLSMSLYGLSSMAEELLPVMNIGPLVLSAEYFAFIPLAMCMLFHPFYTALGAATGGLIFGGILAGQFGGFGEIEQFIALSLGLFVAGSLVRDPKNKKQIAAGALAGAVIFHGIGSMADIQQVILSINDLQTVPGLAEILILVEVGSFLTAIVISGLLFGLLPTLYLVPLLNGKIEPILGVGARSHSQALPEKKTSDVRGIAKVLLLIGIVFVSDYLYEAGVNVEWQASFAKALGHQVLLINLFAAGAIATTTMGFMAEHKNRSLTEYSQEDYL